MDTQIIQPKTYQDFMEAGWANLQNKYFSKGKKVEVHIVGEDCYEDVEFQDDSFDPQYGTEHISSYFCAKCSRHLEDYEPEERW